MYRNLNRRYSNGIECTKTRAAFVCSRDISVRELILDLSGMSFMDSAGLGVILGRFRKLSMRGGKLVVKGMSASVDRIFQMSGLYAIVERQ